jgi:hypothetical protein
MNIRYVNTFPPVASGRIGLCKTRVVAARDQMRDFDQKIF